MTGGRYAGGQTCAECGEGRLSVIDRYCRFCGSKLRELEDFET